MEANLRCTYFAQWGGVLIVLYPEYFHAMYFDSSKNIRKKDYTHIKSVLDNALLTFSLSGGYIKVKKHRKNGLGFGHKTHFYCIQLPYTSKADGFYLMHHLIEYRRDNQHLHMSATTNDAEIVK